MVPLYAFTGFETSTNASSVTSFGTSYQLSAVSCQLSASESGMPACVSLRLFLQSNAHNLLFSKAPNHVPASSDTPLRSPNPSPSAETAPTQRRHCDSIPPLCWLRFKKQHGVPGWSARRFLLSETHASSRRHHKSEAAGFCPHFQNFGSSA